MGAVNGGLIQVECPERGHATTVGRARPGVPNPDRKQKGPMTGKPRGKLPITPASQNLCYFVWLNPGFLALGVSLRAILVIRSAGDIARIGVIFIINLENICSGGTVVRKKSNQACAFAGVDMAMSIRQAANIGKQSFMAKRGQIKDV